MRSARRKHRILALSLIAVVAGVTLLASLASGWAGAQAKPKTYPREQTLVTTGTQWGEIAGFNPYRGNYAVGMVGLCNETLLRYDPLKDRYINWLAKRARFTGPNEFTVTIRSGIKWSDEKPFTSEDVAWNFKLGRFSTAFWNGLYLGLRSIKTPKIKTKVTVKNKKGKVVKACKKVKKKIKGKTRNKRVCKKKYRIVLAPGNRVVFTFADTPNYAQWQNLLWNLPMISPKQDQAITDPVSLTTYSPYDPIGTGPYTLDREGFDPETRVVWQKKPIWWAAQQGVAPSPNPTYIIDVPSGCTLAWLGCGFMVGFHDLDNTYMPGIQGLVSSGAAQTYYPGPPYHLSASTAWLTPNTTHMPLDDRAFRRALAQAIDVDKIVTNDYGNLVLPASPTGLLPIWNKWINAGLVASKGFSFSTSDAIATLTAAGYKQVGDWFVNKDGSPIDLGLAVPSGWSDRESARDMIIADLQAAHIHAHQDVGDFNHYQTERNSGTFDLVIDNSYQMSDNPWTYWNGIFHLPIIAGGSGQTFANFERYANAAAWADVQKLDQVPPGNTAQQKTLNDQLQSIFMDELPLIPLWYDGLWSQTPTLAQAKYWTNWPQNGTDRQFVPTMWRGYLQMTGIDMITHLEPAR